MSFLKKFLQRLFVPNVQVPDSAALAAPAQAQVAAQKDAQVSAVLNPDEEEARRRRARGRSALRIDLPTGSDSGGSGLTIPGV